MEVNWVGYDEYEARNEWEIDKVVERGVVLCKLLIRQRTVILDVDASWNIWAHTAKDNVVVHEWREVDITWELEPTVFVEVVKKSCLV